MLTFTSPSTQTQGNTQGFATGRRCSSSPPSPSTSQPPQVFTMIVKEVKLMALSRGLRLHQYLDNWLIRSQSYEEAQVNTQAVVDLTQSLGWIVNQEKSELKPTQGYATLYRRLKQRLERSLRSKFYQGSVVRPGKKATHKRSRIEGSVKQC